MLNPVGVARHVAVGASIAAAPVLVLVGLIGGGVHGERFDAKQVVVTPAGDGVRIRETVDQDFGTNDRHGYQRLIPTDFGEPTDIVASSPDAPDFVSATTGFGITRLRIGDPDTVVDGQHRYVLSYTLPEARLSSGMLALDIIGTDEELETGRFEVVLAGFELSAPTCNVGDEGDVGGCTLTRDGDVYRAVIEPLAAGHGVTVGGTIISTSVPAEVPIPDQVPRRSVPLPLAAGAAALGAAAGFGGFRLARRLGRNEIGDGGAADAAYGAPGGPTRLVSDKELATMSTTEFEPPRGIRPWHGAILLNERIDSTSVSAWFSDQIALGVLSLTADEPQVMTAGPNFATADPATKQRIDTLLGGMGSLTLGTYQSTLADAWREVEQEQRTMVKASGWWTKFAPGTPPSFPFGVVAVVGFGIIAVVIAAFLGYLRSWPVALAIGALVPAVAAASAYRKLLPQRSAAGSALALRAESFRRFLQASEGSHVEWAWQHGLLREYSAWAVALGAAAAWQRAVAASAVPPTDIALQTAPLLLYSHMGAWSQTHTAPAPTSTGGGSGGGSSGFSGFSGGSVGGGGGGGSSGSW